MTERSTVPVRLKMCVRCKVLRRATAFVHNTCQRCFREASFATAAANGFKASRACSLCGNTGHKPSKCLRAFGDVKVPLPAPGLVYFIEAVGTDSIKIGWTRKLRQRFRALQQSCPVDLKLLCAEAGAKSDERQRHLTFWQDRIRGEWFYASDELRKHIDDVRGLVRP